MKTDESLEELTKEKSLGDVYTNVVKRLPSPRRGLYRAIVGASFVIVSGLNMLPGHTAAEIGARVRDGFTLGFYFCVGMVSVLLAGFAIMSTLATTPLAPRLATLRHASGILYAKYIAGQFVALFLPFLAFLVACFLIATVGWFGGASTVLVHLLSAAGGFDVGFYGGAIAMGVLAAWVATVVIALQSFLFNVYASFLFIVRGIAELSPEIEKLREHEAEAVREVEDAKKKEDGVDAKRRAAEERKKALPPKKDTKTAEPSAPTRVEVPHEDRVAPPKAQAIEDELDSPDDETGKRRRR